MADSSDDLIRRGYEMQKKMKRTRGSVSISKASVPVSSVGIAHHVHSFYLADYCVFNEEN